MMSDAKRDSAWRPGNVLGGVYTAPALAREHGHDGGSAGSRTELASMQIVYSPRRRSDINA